MADGDTVVLASGETIRLVQIDTPEVYGDTECYGRQASALTESILPAGTRVRVATDPALDQRDRDGRTLAYVWKGSSLVNLRLVREGAAAPVFLLGRRGEIRGADLQGRGRGAQGGQGALGPLPQGLGSAEGDAGSFHGPRECPQEDRRRWTSSNCNPNYTPCVPNSAGPT